MKKNKYEYQILNGKAFTDFCNFTEGEFDKESIFRRTKITQGLFWTDFDKDLASQYIREEHWIFGIKVGDALKIIIHGKDDDSDKSTKVGFIK